jgi:hypothetical protein
VVLHQEPGAATVPGIHGGTPHEEEELVIGGPDRGEGSGGVSQGGIAEACHGGGPR